MSRMRVWYAPATALVLFAVGCSSGSPFESSLASIAFETSAVPPGGAGQLYNVVIRFRAEGGAALPNRFQLEDGVYPTGVRLIPDTEDNDLDGLPDPDGAPTGHARLLGYAREPGSYAFTIKAISTGDETQPDVAASAAFNVTIGEGTVSVLTPTAAEGTTDPDVPAFPDSVPFVNPANPNAFFSFAFEVAGGSGTNLGSVYMPRELELSVFDASVVADKSLIDFDTDEGGDSKFEPNFADGGLFSDRAGDGVQVGGFQSPRGPVGTITRHAGGPGLDPDWFQKDPSAGGPARNSRRSLGDSRFPNGDTTLGTPLPVQFSDYFDDLYEDTHAEASPRRKYPFTANQYHNAFFVPYTEGVDLTPLRFRLIVEIIDNGGTVTDKSDDVISRRAYVAQVQIPIIRIDTLVLADGTAGVDYTEFLNASGGVPPLSFELEYVDALVDDRPTTNVAGQLDKATLGLEVDAVTGQFFGHPRVEGDVELTFRAFAAVMSPVQGGPAAVPTGTVGEFDGPLTLSDGTVISSKRGRHRTLMVNIASPNPLMVTTTSLKPGVDGLPYPGDALQAAGGVPTLVPEPVGFTGTYPSATASRTFSWSASYILDTSHGALAGTTDLARELPNDLVLDGDPLSPNSGMVTGIPYDRGFHPVTVRTSDSFLGLATAPNAGARLEAQRTIALSVSPDTAVYMRGMQAAEGSGGERTGLLDATAQMGEARMVPMFLKAAIVKGSTGQQPQIFTPVPGKVDLLPVMLANGGSDAHVDKSIPSVSGFWPAESNKQDRWWYYYYGHTEEAWKHLQQEMCWIQSPAQDHARVFLWGETKIKKFNSSDTSTALGKRYQAYDQNGKRGVLVVNPLTGDFWIPAILDNELGEQDGSQFGAEYCFSSCGYDVTGTFAYLHGYVYSGYERYYNYAQYMSGTREARLLGLGSYIEPMNNSYIGLMPQGRTAVSVAMSADGVWAATAMPGGNGPKILVWRTDKQPIPGDIIAQAHVRGLTGKDADGNDLPNSACVVDLGGVSASGVSLGTDQRYLFPDSLMFVKDGLLFLMERQLTYVFGMSLVDGHLSSKSVNSRSALISGMFTGPSANSTDGMFIPDQDKLRGMKAEEGHMVQFSFAGNEPAAGEEGPDRVAFVAGDNYVQYSYADYNHTYTNLTNDSARKGYSQSANRAKALLFLEMSTSVGGGLDLNASTLKDLTGNNSNVYGDLLSPGRLGEELDFLSVSPDGKYVAVVRDYSGYSTYSYYYYYLNPTFASNTTSSTSSYYVATDDILLVSTEGNDMDSGTSGTQAVLYLGTGTYSSSYSGTPSANSASYASAAAWINAKARRICGVAFADDGRTLLFTYRGDDSYWTKYNGGSIQYGINGHPGQSSTYMGLSDQISVRWHFRTASDGAIDFRNSSSAGDSLKNNLEGMGGVGPVGDTSVPFTNTNHRTSGGSEQQFWATFKSPDGRFIYFISDRQNGRNFMVGLNVTGGTINGHAPFEAFSPHASTVGFEQFDVNCWNYENRFAAVPAGVAFGGSGRDGAGIVFVIASDASAGATNAVDLEVYAFDANIGGDMIVLTSDVTTGSANAINHIYASTDGNMIAGQRAKTTANSGPNRTIVNNQNDLFVVTNVHAVLAGGAPNAFILSTTASHGSSVAFVGEGTLAGPQALIYSSAASGTNTSWDDRTLKIGLLAPGASYELLDSTQSHYAVLAGGRTLDDDATTAD